MLQILGGADVPRIREGEASALVKFAKLRALFFNRLHGLRSDRLISFRLVEPQSSIASSSSRRKISSTLSTPSCPATVNPQRIGRPTKTARAPSAIAFAPCSATRRPSSLRQTPLTTIGRREQPQSQSRSSKLRSDLKLSRT